jgi:hypothetical protein
MRKVAQGKPVKLLILLLTSMLIATASAAVYYSLTMQPTITITAPPIVFSQGSDWPSGSSIGTNSTWVSLALKAFPNATTVYTDALNVSNVDSTSHNFRLRHTSITPASGQSDVGNFTFINFVVEDTSGVAQNTFNYTTTGYTWNLPSTTGYMNLPANTQWIIYIETRGAAGAISGISASIGIAVDIQQ